jgi:amino acid transporter
VEITPNPGDTRVRAVRVVVATTVLLTFISFWRAAAIVLNDMGSTAFYIGGIVEQALGKSAPWFILAIMLFSYIVRAVYIESSAMFVRGGVYRVVKEAMGGTLAKLSVSALLFDYVLTGPISGVSAGQYIAGLLNDVFHRFGSNLTVPVNATAAFIAVLITVYFWWRNTQGIHESSDDALKIMQVVTVMVVLMIVWCGATLLIRGGGPLPPAPTLKNIQFSDDALGWLKGTIWPTFTAVAILMGFGHSILAMSGEESLAQVYREIEHPKVKNLKRAGFVIVVYSLIFTALVSFFATAIIPDKVRPDFYNNLISGLAMHVAGPLSARLAFQAFVVIVGFLMLAGAVNTAIVGSNGVLNRVSEDGVMTDWFRKPHKKYGTTYRLINLITLLQLFTIVVSRGNVYVLGEAYAFGVVWSFAFKSLAMFVLRYTEPDAPTREWKVPLNPKIGGREFPLGLGLITLSLFAAATINLFTKQTATISGVLFTLMFYAIFVVSERITRKRHAKAHEEHTDQFQLMREADVGLEQLHARPGCVLVPVRDYNTLKHLDQALTETNTEERDIVVMTIRLLKGPDAGVSDIEGEELFTGYEQVLFTRVVSLAERHGRAVKLLVVPGTNVFDAMARTAVQLQAREIVLGGSAKMSADAQALQFGQVWDRVPHERSLVTELVIHEAGLVKRFSLGAHAPDLSPQDVERIHLLWVEAVKIIGPQVHHRDVVAAALDSLQHELADRPDAAVARLREQAH